MNTICVTFFATVSEISRRTYLARRIHEKCRRAEGAFPERRASSSYSFRIHPTSLGLLTTRKRCGLISANVQCRRRISHLIERKKRWYRPRLLELKDVSSASIFLYVPMDIQSGVRKKPHIQCVRSFSSRRHEKVPKLLRLCFRSRIAFESQENSSYELKILNSFRANFRFELIRQHLNWNLICNWILQKLYFSTKNALSSCEGTVWMLTKCWISSDMESNFYYITETVAFLWTQTPNGSKLMTWLFS